LDNLIIAQTHDLTYRSLGSTGTLRTELSTGCIDAWQLPPQRNPPELASRGRTRVEAARAAKVVPGQYMSSTLVEAVAGAAGGGFRPASTRRRVNRNAVYCLSSTGRCNAGLVARL
jgi:hypothetical protein